MTGLFSSRTKKIIFLAFLSFVLCSAMTFASTTTDDLSTTLSSNMNVLLAVLGSPWVKGIAIVALIVLALGMFISHEQGVIKKFIPWIFACIIFMCAGSITNKFITSDDSTFQIQTSMIQGASSGVMNG